ncbi:hypothetical protein Glove_487g11 [Diversispora epigaea]|uniref:Uncharacterized protein n=1 Tax=Diversispora epigaea TaxID=1348612 RepID=A0A397GL11_9GLOM|nr:hypothetical protein Glove_487g11 [Diversispora epigaea]
MFEPDDYRTCLNCGEVTYIDIRKLCQQCYTSGNKNIDNFIKHTQLSGLKLYLKEYHKLKPELQPYLYLEWVPFNNFLDIEYIAEGGFSKIFKATWNLNGQKRNIVLKVLNYSNNMDTKFLNEKIVHCDLHSGNILIIKNDFEAVISDLGFSQRVTSNSENSKKPQIPFHDRGYGPILILDILDGKRPKTTKNTPEYWKNLMKKCWHPNPSQRPTIDEIYQLFLDFEYYCDYSKGDIKKNYPDKNDIWLEFKKAEKARLEMIKSKNPLYEHPNSKYFSISLDSMLESIIDSGKFDITNNNSNRINNIENIENSEPELSDQFSNDNFDVMDSNTDRIYFITRFIIEFISSW